jgi:hypothetical protein
VLSHFAGLKNTLLAIRQGIERKLSEISHLAVNYRTTRDVLLLGNNILSVAKRAFPDAIEFARPDTSSKDLGIKVELCDWAATLAQTGIRPGGDQTLIYSPEGAKAFDKAATEWIGPHPFILSLLDSKENLDCKTRHVDEKRVATLRMLRELYVAVTRAQRRVVVLIKKGVTTMRSFLFDALDYDFQVIGADFVQMELDHATTAKLRRQEGHELFEDARYLTASRCCNSSGDQGWSQWANGQYA